MVVTARWGSWKPKPAPAWASLVTVIVVVVVVAATVTVAPLTLRCEVLDESAFGEVVPVGGVELTPFVVIPADRSGIPVATCGVQPGRLPWASLRGQDGGSFLLVQLGTRIGAVACWGFLLGTAALDPSVCLGLPSVLVCQSK